MSDRLALALAELAAAIRAEIATETRPAADLPDRLYSIAEACELMSVTRSTLYQKVIGAGELRTVKVGRRRLVPSGAIRDYIAGRGAA